MGAITPTVLGTAEGPVETLGSLNELRVPFTMAGPASYDTGGSVINIPAAVKGRKLRSVIIANPLNTALSRYYAWDGSPTAPKLVALTALPGTQVTAATNLSGDTIRGELVFEG